MFRNCFCIKILRSIRTFIRSNIHALFTAVSVSFLNWFSDAFGLRQLRSQLNAIQAKSAELAGRLFMREKNEYRTKNWLEEMESQQKQQQQSIDEMKLQMKQLAKEVQSNERGNRTVLEKIAELEKLVLQTNAAMQNEIKIFSEILVKSNKEMGTKLEQMEKEMNAMKEEVANCSQICSGQSKIRKEKHDDNELQEQFVDGMKKDEQQQQQQKGEKGKGSGENSTAAKNNEMEKNDEPAKDKKKRMMASAVLVGIGIFPIAAAAGLLRRYR